MTEPIDPRVDPRITIVCMPILGTQHVPFSRPARCSRCHTGVWVAPSSQELLAVAGALARTVCPRCAVTLMEKDPAPTLAVIPGQLEELRDHLNKEN